MWFFRLCAFQPVVPENQWSVTKRVSEQASDSVLNGLRGHRLVSTVNLLGKIRVLYRPHSESVNLPGTKIPDELLFGITRCVAPGKKVQETSDRI